LAFQCHKRALELGPGRSIVAVVGAAHAQGMAEEWAALVSPVPKTEAPLPEAGQKSRWSGGGEMPPKGKSPKGESKASSSPVWGSAGAAPWGAGHPLLNPGPGSPPGSWNKWGAPAGSKRVEPEKVYSPAYLASIDSLYETEGARKQVVHFAQKMVVAEVGVLLGAYAAFVYAKSRGGTAQRLALGLKKLSYRAGVASTVTSLGGMWSAYGGVRVLQQRRLDRYQATNQCTV